MSEQTPLVRPGWNRAAQLPPWEQLAMRFDTAGSFRADLSVEQQRDELLAAVGLLLDWANEVLAQTRMDDVRWPLMVGTIATMGQRYGPWSR